MPNVFSQGYTSEDISIELIPQTLEINVSDTAYTTEDITASIDSLQCFIFDNAYTTEVNYQGYTLSGDIVEPTEVITMEVGGTDLKIYVDELVQTQEVLFDYISINVFDSSIATESLTWDPLRISIIENVSPADTTFISRDLHESIPSQPWDGATHPPEPIYGDNESALLLRGDTGYVEEDNFWNQPFPNDLKTVSGATANFSKTWNKTHSSLKRRKCSIKVEVLRSDNSTQIIDVGTFLIDKTDHNEDDSVTLKLEDLTKPMIETSASDIKSGYQWYRNIPLHFLVEELVKKNYPDPRNGEIPRDFIINGIRPENPSGEPVISSLGRPPTFTKLTNNLNSIGKTYSLRKADLGINGERLYLGIGQFLYEYNELIQTYYLIGDIKSTATDYGSVVYNIKKLWYNEEDALADKYIYGMAWPTEELIHDAGEFEDDGTTFRRLRYSCITSNDFIIFRANNDGIENLYDSATTSNSSTNKLPTLFSGEYHIVEPYLEGRRQTEDDYYDNSANHDLGGQYPEWNNVWPKKALHVGYGRMKHSTPNPDQSGGDRTRPAIYQSGNSYRCGYTENLIIPYTQTVGFGFNMTNEVIFNQWALVNAFTGTSWSANAGSLVYGNFYRNFSFIPGPEDYVVGGEINGWVNPKGWVYSYYADGIGWAYYCFSCRPRLILKSHHHINDEQPAMLMHTLAANDSTQEDTTFISMTKVDQRYFPAPPPEHPFPSAIQGNMSWEDHEIFNCKLASTKYFKESERWEHLPWENNTEHRFDPGFFSWYFEGMITDSYNWQYAPIPWLKYSSGQTGSVHYIKDYGTKGGIFFQGQVKDIYTGSLTKTIFKTMSAHNDVGGTSVTYRYDLKLKCFILDLDTNVLHTIEGMDETDFVDTREDGNSYQKQITGVTCQGTNLFVASHTFPNKHKVVPNQSENENKFQTKAYLQRVILGGLVGNEIQTSITDLLDKSGDYGSGNPDYVIMDLNVLSNHAENKKLYITYYEKDKVLNSSEFDERPTIGNCYGVAHHGMTGLSSSLENNAFDPPGPGHGGRLMPYPMLHITESSEKPDGGTPEGFDFQNSFYAVEPMSRTEELTNVRLRRFGYDESFYPTQGYGGYTHPYLDPISTLGYISEAVYGESNQLSNLELMTLGGFEIVYGVSSGYYRNPINRVGAKNHLWKYDTYLGGIIELADLSGLKVWEAITQLANGFNYLTGFDDDRFFFIPKSLSATPDILLDLDLDGVISTKKIRDDKVENIIRSTPWIATVGNVDWTVTLVPNETTVQDDGRTQLNVDLRVRQDDDLSKRITLKVHQKGSVTQEDSISKLRFSYLIYNHVLESKLIRDVSGIELILTLPSFFGQDLNNQVKRGDLIAVIFTDEDSGETTTITRVIADIDYNKNTLRLNSALGQSFKAYTPVTIYRSFTNENEELRNNQWSNEGVTPLYPNDKGGLITWVSGDTRAVDIRSIRNVSVGTIIRLGNYPHEYIVTKVLEDNGHDSSSPRIEFQSYQGSPLMPSGIYQDSVKENEILRAYWASQYNDLIEVGGSKVFLGFAPGSSGSFWMNFRGDDKIQIDCAGLELQQDSRAIITVVDVDSIERYGKISKDLDEIRFIQPTLHEFMARTYLHEKSKPKLAFNITDFIQTIDKGGYSTMVPLVKLLNTSEKKLFTVRIVSKKLLPKSWGYYMDCYIMDHSFNLKTFTQSLLLRSHDTY